MFHLRQVRKAIDDLLAYLRHKSREMQESLQLLDGAHGLNHRQRALLQHALKHPGFSYTVQSHKTSHRVAYSTARSDLLGLVERGLLLQHKVGREFMFVAAPGMEQELKPRSTPGLGRRR